jgi:preprotein translocase subunit SecG
MTGTKLVKIILIPMILFIAAILCVVLMVLKLDIKGNHITKCGVVVIAVAWPLFLSDKWIYGAYSCIVALFISFVSQSPKMFAPFPWWVYRLAWAMAAFQVIMFLGPIDSFHVPFYSQSLGVNTGLENKLLKFTEEACSKHYEDFFTLTTIELNAKGANPDAKYSGLCANGWLNFIQIIQLVQAFLWVATTLVSALAFLTDPTNGVTAKVQPALRAAADATEAPPKAEEKKDEAEEKKDP